MAAADDLREWLSSQVQLVESRDGETRAPACLVLEGPDGKAWGTWPAVSADTAERGVACLATFERTLATGRHAARWVLLDGSREQFACLPIVIQGRSAEAAGAAKDAAAFARSTSQQLLAAEQIVQMQSAVVGRQGQMLDETLTEKFQLQEALANLLNANHDRELEAEKSKRAEERFDAIAREFTPMLGALVQVASKFLGDEYERRKRNGSGRRELDRAAPDGNVAPPPVRPASSAGGSGSTVRADASAKSRPKRSAAARKRKPRA